MMVQHLRKEKRQKVHLDILIEAEKKHHFQVTTSIQQDLDW
jgi:predicted nucleotidyltransferase